MNNSMNMNINYNIVKSLRRFSPKRSSFLFRELTVKDNNERKGWKLRYD